MLPSLSQQVQELASCIRSPALSLRERVPHLNTGPYLIVTSAEPYGLQMWDTTRPV